MQQGGSTVWRRAAAVGAATAVAIGLAVGPGGAAHAASDADALTAVEQAQQLLQYVPSDHRASCARQDPSSFADGNFDDAAAIVQCESPAPAVENLIYVQYGTAEQLAAEYASIVPTGLPASDGTANLCPVESTWRFGDEAEAGRDACFVTTNADGEDVAKMVWTADAPLILGYAFNLDGDGPGIKEWWNDGAGPLAERASDPGLADLTPGGRKAVGRTLIRQAPAAASKCELLDADPTIHVPGDAEWAWLPWLGAEVLCKTPGKGVVYYAQVTRDNAEDYWAAFHESLTDEEYGPKHPAVCKDPKRLVRHGDEVGAVACWYFHQTLWAAWYDRTTGIVAAASAPHLSPQRFLDSLDRNHLT